MGGDGDIVKRREKKKPNERKGRRKDIEWKNGERERDRGGGEGEGA